MAFWLGKAKDPVCGMQVEKKKAVSTIDHMGKTYYFCAPRCKADFAKDPDKYVKEPPKAMGGMGGHGTSLGWGGTVLPAMTGE